MGGDDMPKVTNLKQSIGETIRLLGLPENCNYREMVKICLKQIAQARILELINLSKNTHTIARYTGLSEKTIRFLRDGDQAPKKSNLDKIENYLRKVKRGHVQKSTR
jgi:hypothetical protein